MKESVVSCVKQLVLKSEIIKFQNPEDFVQHLCLGDGDLILSNAYIYEPHFGEMNLPVSVLYQENYGTGEPSDVMIDAILSDAL